MKEPPVLTGLISTWNLWQSIVLGTNKVEGSYESCADAPLYEGKHLFEELQSINWKVSRKLGSFQDVIAIFLNDNSITAASGSLCGYGVLCFIMDKHLTSNLTSLSV